MSSRKLMVTEIEAIQRIARLTPLDDVLMRLDALVQPVPPREVARDAALGRVLARDLAVTARPGVPLALRDGWAVNAGLTTDASAYAPALLPSATRINVGEPLPAGTDAVAEIDGIVIRDDRPQAIAAIAAGDGVLPAGADADRDAALLHEGRLVGKIAGAVLAAAGIAGVWIRDPGVRIVKARPGPDTIIDAACDLVARAVTAEGGRALVGADMELADALQDTRADAVIAIGGTGGGRNDASVSTLARLGRLEVHGVALSPGETAAFGEVGTRPVLLLPGRIDAALAAWLLLGAPMLARVAGRREQARGVSATLARKVASNLGLAELIPVRLREGKAEPLGSGYLPLQTIAQSDGWILVAADREGHPAGATVMVRPWP
jgi:molybdopterin biosynthesis enzyme